MPNVCPTFEFDKKALTVCSMLLCLLLLSSEIAFGQDQTTPKENAAIGDVDQKSNAALDFWMNDFAPQAAAVQVVAAINPLGVICHRVAGEFNLVWGLEVPFSDLAKNPTLEVPTLNPKWLAGVRQRDLKAFYRYRNKPWNEIPWEARYEYEAYVEALVNVAFTSPEAFANAARKNKHLTFGQLYRDSEIYQGEVIPVEGRLYRLRKDAAPKKAEEKLVSHLYEGWVFMNTYKSNPVCVIFANKPNSVPVSEKLDNTRIKFNGYLFKRYGYIDAESNPHGTLLFFAPNFEVISQGSTKGKVLEAAQNSNLSSTVILVLSVLGGGSVLLMLWLTVWFRRNDARVRNELDSIRSRSAVQQLEEMPFEDQTEEDEPNNVTPTARRFNFPDSPN